MKLKRKRVVLIAVLVGLPLMVILLLPDYTRRALIHWYADTDDYKIFANSTVEAGASFAWPVRTGTLREPDAATLDSILQLDPLAFLVIRDDTMICEKYFNGHTDTSVSNIFSATKSIIALLTGAAIRDGLIESIDDPVGKYLPEFNPGLMGENMTIKNLLQMASGLDYDEAYASAFSPTTRSYYSKNITRQMLSLKMKEAPGVHFDYIGAATQVLGMVISRVTEMSISDYASEKLWKPLGAQHDALWSKDRKNGIEKMFCCFTPTAPDLARIGKLLLDSGVWNGNPIIERSYFEAMTTPASQLTQDNVPVDFYGYHIWLTMFQGNRVIYARGIKGQYIFVVPEKKLVIVRLGNVRSDKYIGEHPDCVYLYLRAAFRLIEPDGIY
jgi:CubicO group peptidase (beta-lactamase class C family)